MLFNTLFIGAIGVGIVLVAGVSMLVYAIIRVRQDMKQKKKF